MVVLMAFAACYGVLQLALLTSGTRSVRVSTLLLVVAAGCYGCGTLALVLQLTYTHLMSAVTEQPTWQVVTTASYTIDPWVEEVVKLLPVLVIVLCARPLQRQWGYTDHLLLGAASGTGFALAEALLRCSGRAARAITDGQGGYVILTDLTSPHVRGVSVTLSIWLPPPVGLLNIFDDSPDVNFHLGWTCLSALGLGIAVWTRGRRRFLALLPLLWAGSDHALTNFSAAHSGPGALPVVARAADALRAGLPLAVLLALVAASALDVLRMRTLRRRHPQLLLAAERSGTPSALALVRLAVVALPWTPVLVSRFTLSRRAAWNEMAPPWMVTDSPLHAAVASAAERLDQAKDRALWPRWSWHRGPSHRSASRLRRHWRLGLWIVVIMPAALYLVVGSTSALSGLQALMASRVVFAILSGVCAVGVVYLVCQVVGQVRRLTTAIDQRISDLAVRLISQTAAGTGAAVGGATLVARWITGSQGDDAAVSGFHIVDALSMLALVTGIALILGAAFMFPPLALVLLADGGMMLVTTAVAGEFVALAASGVALGSTGILLANAADANGGFSPTSGTGALASAGMKASPSQKGANLDPDTRAEVQRKLPPEWGVGRANGKGIGTRWFSSSRPKQDGVRVDKGDPRAGWKTQQQDHVVVRHDGKIIGPDGEPINGPLRENPEAHIPLKDWLTWRQWWKP